MEDRQYQQAVLVQYAKNLISQIRFDRKGKKL